MTEANGVTQFQHQPKEELDTQIPLQRHRQSAHRHEWLAGQRAAVQLAKAARNCGLILCPFSKVFQCAWDVIVETTSASFDVELAQRNTSPYLVCTECDNKYGSSGALDIARMPFAIDLRTLEKDVLTRRVSERSSSLKFEANFHDVSCVPDKTNNSHHFPGAIE